MNRNVRRIIPYCLGLFLWLPGKLTAQRVLYSESINSRFSNRFLVIGKSENFYWIEKLQKQKTGKHYSPDTDYEIQSFGLFDARLNLVDEQLPIIIPGTTKQWLVTSNKSLDQIVFTCSGKNSFVAGSTRSHRLHDLQ